jgi:predicted RNase H-like nuclease (RuvC/YqgF family)
LSEEQQERIEIDIDDNNGSLSSDTAEPQEIIREEAVEVVKNPNTETFPLSSKEEEDQENEIQNDSSNRYNGDIYEQVKAQSIQLSNLADTVESLQSQVKQLQETIRLLKHKKSSLARKRITSNDGTKTKKKTKRRGNARSR